MTATVPGPARTRGPGEFFRDHRGLYALSLAGALGASGYAAVEARKAEPGRALRWWTLAGLTAAQAVGMAASRRRAPTRARPEVQGAGASPEHRTLGWS